MSDIDIKGLDKAELLAALYNGAKPQGFGFLQATPDAMTKAEAQQYIDRGAMDFDYLKGRVMKIDISGDTMEAWLYDRDNGDGAAQKAVDALRGASPAPVLPKAREMASQLDDFLRSVRPPSPVAPEQPLTVKKTNFKLNP